MSSSLYPNSEFMPTPSVCEFFSAIPRAVLDLCHRKVLTSRDVHVLGILLDYKNQRTTEVDPKQETIAARMGCSVPTVERSVARLVKAGLITKTRLRNSLGRLGRCVYDLARTLALMPRQAAKMRGGQFGKSAPAAPPPVDGNRPPAAGSTTHQKCRVSEADLSDVVKADTTLPQSAPAAPSPVVASPVVTGFVEKGVFPRVAAALVERFGEKRCQEALDGLNALKQRQKVRNAAAWLVGCVQQGWSVTTSPPPRPQAQRPYAPLSGPARPAPDCLDALAPAVRAALEGTARAALRMEFGGALPQGRRLVEGRMRALLGGQT